MKCSSGKQRHKTEREAQDHLNWQKRQPHSHGLKHLNVYQCGKCDGWHVGRAWRSSREKAAAKPTAKPAVKPPTPGQLRRAARKAEEKAKHDAFYADYADNLRICKILVDREFARMEALGIKQRTTGESK